MLADLADQGLDERSRLRLLPRSSVVSVLISLMSGASP